MNAVTLTAVIRRESPQRIRIEFARSGVGDDIVDQWADRLELAARFCVAQTTKQAEEIAAKAPSVPPEIPDVHVEPERPSTDSV